MKLELIDDALCIIEESTVMTTYIDNALPQLVWIKGNEVYVNKPNDGGFDWEGSIEKEYECEVYDGRRWRGVRPTYIYRSYREVVCTAKTKATLIKRILEHYGAKETFDEYQKRNK